MNSLAGEYSPYIFYDLHRFDSQLCKDEQSVYRWFRTGAEASPPIFLTALLDNNHMTVIACCVELNVLSDISCTHF
jgi:hypothetical protein